MAALSSYRCGCAMTKVPLLRRTTLWQQMSTRCCLSGANNREEPHHQRRRGRGFSSTLSCNRSDGNDNSFQETVAVTKAKHSSPTALGVSGGGGGVGVGVGVGVLSEDTALVDSLLETTANMVDSSAHNVIAFSGGVDSSLTAALVHQVYFPQDQEKGGGGSVRAILGLSRAVPQEQVELARHVAAVIGIPYEEVLTREGSDPTYLANQGQACLVCKTHLYTALQAVAHRVSSSFFVDTTLEDDDDDDDNGNSRRPCPSPPKKVLLYNGTNADDRQDPTRLGLIAAGQFQVQSPLAGITKAEVRRAARVLGLPNWNYAASPCLRSRLAWGVQASQHHLTLVDKAERFVRNQLPHIFNKSVNLRVRLLPQQVAAIEVDAHVLPLLPEEFSRLAQETFQTWGFASVCQVRAFRSGSVAAAARTTTTTMATTNPNLEKDKKRHAAKEEEEEEEEEAHKRLDPQVEESLHATNMAATP